MLWLDNCKSVVTEGRSLGGPSIQIQSADASLFGVPDASDNLLRLSFFDANGDPQGILNCTGRTGSTLTLAVPAGTTDFAVETGWTVANVPTAQDLLDLQGSKLWLASSTSVTQVGAGTEADPVRYEINTDVVATTTYVDAAVGGKLSNITGLITQGSGVSITGAGTSASPYLISAAVDLSAYATTTYVDSGLNGKANATTVTTLIGRVDALEAAPQPLTLLGRWRLGVEADLTDGEAVDLADVPVPFAIAYVTVNAQTNPSGGGFSFQLSINGSTDVFAAAQAYAADTSATTIISTFASASLAAGDQLSLATSAAGTGVREAVISIWGYRS